MSSLALAEFDVFEAGTSPSFLRYEPSVSLLSSPSPAPGYDLSRKRAARGLDLLMDLSESQPDMPLNSSITPPVIAKFLSALPANLPTVEPYVSAQGSVCFDWDDEPSNALSLLLQSDTRLAYAAYFSGERIHGTVNLQTAFPGELLSLINRWAVRNAAN